LDYEAAFPCRFQEDSELASNHEIASIRDNNMNLPATYA